MGWLGLRFLWTFRVARGSSIPAAVRGPLGVEWLGRGRWLPVQQEQKMLGPGPWLPVVQTALGWRVQASWNVWWLGLHWQGVVLVRTLVGALG